MKKDLKKIILDFLQNKSYETIKKNTGVFDLKYIDNPDRILVTCSDKNILTELEYKGTNLPLEYNEIDQKAIVIKDNKKTVGVTEVEKKDEVFHREIGEEAAKSLSISEAIGPQSKTDNKEAFKSWKKRHTMRKISK